ncbi:hypothetical protein SDC9_46798 [bioreactor metagenome]|uniref:Uncharacterized protein n=1 Tax=bioreactor metagenome TaxID=1076179 RepID=A0A644WAR7_9ZZZZ
MNITPKDKIGYISRSRDKDGKEHFRFIESKIKKVVVGKTKTSVYSDHFYTLDADEIISNTEIISKGNLMLVTEPFITTDEYSEHCRKVVEYWNEHGAKGLLDKEDDDCG